MSSLNQHTVNRRRGLSVRAALMLVTSVAVLPAAAIIVWNGLEHGATLERMVREEAQRQIESLAEVQLRITDSARNILGTLATQSAFLEADHATRVAILDAVRVRNPDYVNLTVTDAQGWVVASALLPEGFNLGDRKHVRDALLSGSFAVGEHVLAYIDGEPGLPFSHPVVDEDGIVTGMVSAVYRLSAYRELFDQLGLPPDTILGIVDHRGVRLFFHPQRATNPVGAPIQSEMWNVISSGSESGSVTLSGSDGVRRYYAYRVVRLHPGAPPYLYMVLGIPEAHATAPARSMLGRGVALMVAVIAVAFAIARFLGEATFGARFRAVVATAARVQAGDLSARTGIASDRAELGTLAAAIDRMTESIEQRINEREAAERVALESLRLKETLLKEIHHRVKNNLQLILSLIRLASSDDPGSARLAAALETRVGAMALVHELLYETGDLATIDLTDYVPRLVELVTQTAHRAGAVTATVDVDEVRLVLDQAVPFALLLNELVTNACKHGMDGTGSTVTVRVRSKDDQVELEVRDQGPGLPPQFDPHAAPTLGLKLVPALTTQLRGVLGWNSNGGACFWVHFPVRAAATQPVAHSVHAANATGDTGAC